MNRGAEHASALESETTGARSWLEWRPPTTHRAHAHSLALDPVPIASDEVARAETKFTTLGFRFAIAIRSADRLSFFEVEDDGEELFHCGRFRVW